MHISRRLFLARALLRADSAPEQVEVYRSGQDGYFSYRIPSLLATKRGALLAFCEGQNGASMAAVPGVRRKWLRIAAPTQLAIPVRLWTGRAARSGWR
jgi:hypothetical protein